MLAVWQVFVTIVRICSRVPFETPPVSVYVTELCASSGATTNNVAAASSFILEHSLSRNDDRIAGAAEKLLLTLSLVRLNLIRLFIR